MGGAVAAVTVCAAIPVGVVSLRDLAQHQLVMTTVTEGAGSSSGNALWDPSVAAILAVVGLGLLGAGVAARALAVRRLGGSPPPAGAG